MQSWMSARSRHIPKNAEFTRSPKVAEGGDAVDLTIITIEAEPVGTSAGSVTRSSRLAGISVLSVTVFTMGVSPASHLIKANMH